MIASGSKLPLTRGHKKRERTKNILLAAGFRVFAEKGESVKISDVVNEAGVSNGTFYNYFSDRKDLFDALAKQMAIDATDEFNSEIQEADPALRFGIITALGLARAAADPTWGQVILRLEALRQSPGKLAERHLSDDINRGFAQGRFSVGAEDATIDLIVAATRITIRKIVNAQATRSYVLSVIANLLCSLGLGREEALEIAALSIKRANITL